MSGPAYPRPGAPHGIGTFVIGVDPVGTIPTFDYWPTVISQYANSERLMSLIDDMNDALNQTVNIENLYDLIWNIETAQGYGLDVLGRIVGVSRTIPVVPDTQDKFGFEEPGAGAWTGFGQGGFSSGDSSIAPTFSLPDDQYRALIYAKAAANICDGSIPAVNAILMTFFKNRGTCYVADGLDMTLTYTFDFTLSALELAIVQLSGVLPNPCGIVVNIAQP